MPPYFKPLRRKIGVLTLVMACALIASIMITRNWHAAISMPTGSHHWSNILSDPDGGQTRFLMGSIAIGDRNPSVAYLVRIDDLSLRGTAIPRLDEENGHVVFNGQIVPREEGTLKLFIDDGRVNPLRIDIPYNEAKKYFKREDVYFDRFERAKSFWDDVLCSESLLAVDTREPIKGTLHQASNGIKVQPRLNVQSHRDK